jgi:hypothetical protein
MASDNPYAELVEKNPYAGMVNPQYKIGVEGLSQATEDVAGDFHPMMQMAMGSRGAAEKLGIRFKQLFNRDMQKPGDKYQLTPEDQAKLGFYEGLNKASAPAVAGDIITGAGLTMPLGGPAYSLGSKAASSVLPAWLAKSAGAGLSGATTGMVSSPLKEGETDTDRLKEGGLFGVLGDAVFRGGARVIRPIMQSDPVKRLLEKNIVPTMGQAQGGVLRDIEEKAQSLPLVGRFIGGAKDRARDELNRAGLQMAMPPGAKATDVGNAGVENAKVALGQAYDDLYQGTRIGRDSQLVQELEAAVRKPVIPLSQAYKKAYKKIIDTEVLDRLPAVEADFPTAEVKKQIEAGLGKAIRELGPMPSGQDNALKTALMEARDAVRRLANRGAGIDLAERATLDRGYANMKNMEDAARKAAAKGGVATPYQILRSSPKGTPLNKMAEDAQGVMGSTVPNSGTADRALMANLLFGTPTMIGTAGAPYLAALAASPFLYSRAGQRYMLGNLPLQGVLSENMRALAPYAAAGGGVLAGQ